MSSSGGVRKEVDGGAEGATKEKAGHGVLISPSCEMMSSRADTVRQMMTYIFEISRVEAGFSSEFLPKEDVSISVMDTCIYHVE